MTKHLEELRKKNLVEIYKATGLYAYFETGPQPRRPSRANFTAESALLDTGLT